MKTSARGVREIIEQAGMKQYFLKLIFDIPQVGLSCVGKLKFEDQAFVSNLFEALCEITEEHIKDEPIYAANNSGGTTPFNKGGLALFVMNLFTKAVERVDEKGRSLFNIYIDEEKDKLKAYRDKSKETVDTLKKQISVNENKARSFQRQAQPTDPVTNATNPQIVPVVVDEVPGNLPKKVNLSDILMNG